MRCLDASHDRGFKRINNGISLHCTRPHAVGGSNLQIPPKLTPSCCIILHEVQTYWRHALCLKLTNTYPESKTLSGSATIGLCPLPIWYSVVASSLRKCGYNFASWQNCQIVNNWSIHCFTALKFDTLRALSWALEVSELWTSTYGQTKYGKIKI